MDEIIKRAIEYLENIFDGNSDGHGADHSLRVYNNALNIRKAYDCLLYTSPSPRDYAASRMPSSA